MFLFPTNLTVFTPMCYKLLVLVFSFIFSLILFFIYLVIIFIYSNVIFSPISAFPPPSLSALSPVCVLMAGLSDILPLSSDLHHGTPPPLGTDA